MTIITLKEILIACQDSSHQSNLIQKFYKLYNSMDKDDFIKEFLALACHPMMVYAREPSVERTIAFLSKATTNVAIKESQKATNGGQDDEEDEVDTHPLLSSFLNFLLDVHSAKERAVRFRTCQLVTQLLKDMGDGAKIEDDLYDRIYSSMVERLKDKCPQVRVHAVLALARLQNPRDESCPIVKAYMILMTKDPNKEVRRTILTCIAPSAYSLACILERTRDVAEAVRRTAFAVIAEKIPLKALTIQQRVDLLQSGLCDRSELVQAACCGKLLQSWLVSCQGSALELLERLDVQSSVKTCKWALGELFKTAGVMDVVEKFDILDTKLLIPDDKLSCESAFYWMSVVEYVSSQGHEFEERLDRIRPNCVEFCSYINAFSEQLRQCTDMDKLLDLEFILEQLLQLLSVMDLSDTASRKAAEKLTHHLLVAEFIGPSLVPHILPCLGHVQASTEQLVNCIAETVSDIREPTTQVETALTIEQRIGIDKKIASIRVKINELREELSDSIEKQDFERAAQLKANISTLDVERSSLLEETAPTIEEVRTQRNDPLTILKCLTIVCELLKVPDLQKWSPQLQGLMDSQVIPGMVNEEAEVRNVAVRAIGLCCQIKKEMIMQHLPLLLQATQVDTPSVRATSLKAIFDIILTYGLDSFNGNEASGLSDQREGEEGADKSTNESSTSVFESSASESMEDDGEKRGWSETASKVVAILSSALNSEIPELRCVSAEGLSKLILAGRVVSPKLLSHLVLLWFNPLMEDDESLSQILGAFFPLFAFSSSDNQQLVEEAFLPTLKTLTRAPATSPLSEVNDVNVASFMVELMDARHLVENVKANVLVQENPCHDTLAMKLCNEILSNPDSFAVRLWLRSLNQLILSPDKQSLHKDLFKMTEKIAMVVTEKNCLKLLKKFCEIVTDMTAAYSESGQVCAPSDTISVTASVEQAEETEPTEVASEEPSDEPQVKTKKTTRKSVQTPSVGRGASAVGVTSARRSTRAGAKAGAPTFATPGPRSSRPRDPVEETRQNLENLMSEHLAAKTPVVAGTQETEPTEVASEEPSDEPQVMTKKTTRKSVQTPSVGRGASAVGVTSARRSTRAGAKARAPTFATPGPRSSRPRDPVEETPRQNLENLMSEHLAAKMPVVAGTPKTPKRPLHSIQDPAYTE